MVSLVDEKDATVKVDTKETLPDVESDTKDTKLNTTDKKAADELLKFMEQHEPDAEPLTPEEERRFRRKNFITINVLATLVTVVLFMDKASIGYTAILGIYADTGINKSDFNNLNTIFYGGYLLAQWPCHILMQKLPLGKYVAFSILSWSIVIGLTAACNSLAGLLVTRFFLGAVEAVVVPAVEITLGMFLTVEEREITQPIFWASTAAAPFISSFVAFGLLHTNTSVYPWRIFMAINAAISLLLFVVAFIWYPDNPANAKFLSIREKVHLVKRVQASTKSSIEQKQIKKHQIIETLKDPISWLFLLQAFTLMLSNSMTYQQNQLFVDIGVDNLGSSLVSAAAAIFDIGIMIFFAFVIKRFPKQNGIIGAICVLPPIAAAIAMITIPWEKKYGLLASMIIAGSTKGVTYIVALGWTTSSCSGYTKKLYRNVLFMLGYGVANMISPQLWNPKDAPRYFPSWIVQIVVAFFLNIVILLTIRYILNRRNKQRLAWIAENPEDDDYGIIILDDGTREKVDIAMLDLTDLENKRFIYPL